ncbi:MAG: glycerate kinase [Deltaproteobacteria bacterium]|nr:glycerate kinase [Deltaproteobacteria bacterium]
MAENLLSRMRQEAKEIFKASVRRVDPYEAVKNFVRLEKEVLSVGPANRDGIELNLERFERILVVGGGKATAPMAKALEDVLGSRVERGLINVKYGFSEPLSRIEVQEAGHPLPDDKGVAATKKILSLLDGAKEKDLVFSLISGGGSALLPSPAGGITLAEKQAVTKSLLDCGASIDEMNTIRKHISSSKGGQMARVAFPATTINLMLSDVVGDRMDVIASGPFVPDSGTFKDAWEIMRKYDLSVPEPVSAYVKMGLDGKAPETPKDSDPLFHKVHNFIIGSNILALKAAGNAAEAMGYTCLILSSMVEGETREVARVHTSVAKEILQTGLPLAPPACIISGGETTVTIRGKGFGGRNQEFCLAASIELAGTAERIVVLSGGTDGNDGPTPAAGAIVDSRTAARGSTLGLQALEFLKNNDSYHFFEKTGDLLITGPTKTNVMDVRLVLVR